MKTAVYVRQMEFFAVAVSFSVMIFAATLLFTFKVHSV